MPLNAKKKVKLATLFFLALLRTHEKSGWWKVDFRIHVVIADIRSVQLPSSSIKS